MKTLQTLQLILSKVDKKEASQFRGYAIYKNEKKLVKLFDVLYKHKKTHELEFLLLYLKKNKVHQNLRINCKRMYELLLCFWNDSPPQEDLGVEISKRIHGASVLKDKGLLREGLNLLKEAKEVSEKGERFSRQFEILRLSFYWENQLNPKKAIHITEKAALEAELLEKKVKITFTSNVLSSKALYTFIQNNSTSSEKNRVYFDEMEKKIHQLLEMEECSDRAKYMCHHTLHKIHSIYSSFGKDELVRYHGIECVKIAESLLKEDPKKFRPLLILNLYSMLYISFADREKKEFRKYLQKFRKNISNYIAKDKNIAQLNHEIELLNCLLNQEYTNGEKVIIPSVLNYLGKNAENIPDSFCWDLFSLCLQVELSMGKMQEVEKYLQLMQDPEKQTSLSNLNKYITRLFFLLYNFEMGNFELVINTIKSTRRLYAKTLKDNPGGNIFLRYLSKLAKTPNFKDKTPIFRSFKKDIDELYSNSFYNRNMGINILVDWINTKVNQYDTIQQFFEDNASSK